MGIKKSVPTSRVGSCNKKLIFIHGLSGSANGTWGVMHDVLQSSDELTHLAYDCYTYPTSMFRVPFGPQMPGIQQLSGGLRSFIEASCKPDEELILVAHSLGGLVARHYILEAVKAGRVHQVIGLLLYASPLTGAGLADLAKIFSWRHRHLRQLSRGTDFLKAMNTDWISLKIEEHIKVLTLVAGGDAVVSSDSASPYIGADNVRIIIEHGHIGITKPANLDDIRFRFLRSFVLDLVQAPPATSAVASGDILFDSYTLREEEFYIRRQTDEIVYGAVQGAHVWVSGPPGVGKTASLRRLAEISKWRFKHIILDGYQGLTALALMKEVCGLLMTFSGFEEDMLQKVETFQELLRCLRRHMPQIVENGTFAVLIEEIPLPKGEEFTSFLDFAYQLALLSEAASHQGRLIWLFSSVRNPREDVRSGQVKMFEKFQFVEFEYWCLLDITRLVTMISTTLNYELDPENMVLVLERCYGSPRFVKMLFRRTRNEVGSLKSLGELIESVEMDIAK